MNRQEILLLLLGGCAAAYVAVQHPAVGTPVLVGTAVVGALALFLKHPE